MRLFGGWDCGGNRRNMLGRFLATEYGFDSLEKIHDAGYSMITPVLVTNHEEYMDVVSTDDRCVNREDNLITVIA